MNTIAENFERTLKIEEETNTKDSKFLEIKILIDKIKKQGLDRKQDYTLPPKDTIGRSYYSSFNKHRIK